MGPEIVTVTAGGQAWAAFEEFDVEAAANEAARSFKLQIAAAVGGTPTSWVFSAGTLVTVSSNGDPLAVGYVDRYQPQLKSHTHALIHVSGRSKAQDIIDCSALHPTGNFQNQTVLQIAQALDQFGVGFTTDQVMQPIPFYQLTPGESVFRCVEKLCRQQGLILAGQPDGSVKITRCGTITQSPLIEGYNCKGLSADHNWAGRHSQVITRGQRPIGSGAANLQIQQQALDPSVTRFRPLIVHIDEDTDNGRALARAQWQLAREAGHALKAEVTVQGFHDDSGLLWTPGNLTFVDSDFLAIEQVMAIEKVKYTQKRNQHAHGAGGGGSHGIGNGSETHLSLTDPQALGGASTAGQAGQGASTNPAWGADLEGLS